MRTTAEKIIRLATEQKAKIAVAESVTGGLISAALTAVPGASAVFLAGIIAYNENVKIHALGVPRAEIRATHGYSETTVRLMAEHIMKRNGADFAVATSGCAGPEFAPGFENGRVLFALAQRNRKTNFFDERFGTDREEVRQKATEFALQKLLDALEKH